MDYMKESRIKTLVNKIYNYLRLKTPREQNEEDCHFPESNKEEESPEPWICRNGQRSNGDWDGHRR